MEITPEIQAVIDAEVAKRLKDIKGKLDGAYEKRDALQVELDTAVRKATEREAAHQTELATASAKARETGDATANELKARLEQLETHNSNLSRDSLIGAAVGGFSFRNAKAAEVARGELSALLVKGTNGWATKDGRPVEEVAKELFAKEEFSFLLKPTVSTGAGAPSAGAPTPPAKTESLLALSNEALIAKYTQQ